MMAFFGAPGDRDNPARDAFEAAKEMLSRLESLNQRLKARGFDPVAIGIGLHSGEVVIGHVGAAARHEYTAIGDTVNTASRRLVNVWAGMRADAISSEHTMGCSSVLVSPSRWANNPSRDEPPCKLFGWRPPAAATFRASHARRNKKGSTRIRAG